MQKYVENGIERKINFCAKMKLLHSFFIIYTLNELLLKIPLYEWISSALIQY